MPSLEPLLPADKVCINLQGIHPKQHEMSKSKCQNVGVALLPLDLPSQQRDPMDWVKWDRHSPVQAMARAMVLRCMP